MKNKITFRNLMKGSNDWFREGYETYILAKDACHNILLGRKDTIKQEAQDKMNENESQEKALKHEESLVLEALNENGGEVSIKSIQMNIWIGKALIFVSVLLWAAHFGFILWTFEPFGWSYKAYLIAIGVTITFGILCERIFSDLKRLLPDRYYRVGRLYLAVVGAIAIVVAGLYLANIRADLSNVMLMAQQTVDVAGGQEYDQAISEFYVSSFPKLLIALTLFTISLDIVTGILLHLAILKLRDNRVIYHLLLELKKIRKNLMTIAVDNKRLEGAHEVFENQFLNGVALAEAELKDKAENGETYRAKKLVISLGIFIAALVFILILAINTMADTTVVALDLSGSTAHPDYIGITEFEKNKKAIDDVIARVKPGTKIYVTGITEDSLGKPYIIIKAKTSSDPGYFKQNHRRDIRKILHEWQKIGPSLQPVAEATDIFGVIYLAEAMFNNDSSGNKEFIFFSDMRNTSEIDLETLERVDNHVLEEVKEKMRIPDLKGVKVYVYGVGAGDTTEVYRTGLEKFWRDFFKMAGAEVVVYTSLREMRDITGAITMNSH